MYTYALTQNLCECQIGVTIYRNHYQKRGIARVIPKKTTAFYEVQTGEIDVTE